MEEFNNEDIVFYCFDDNVDLNLGFGILAIQHHRNTFGQDIELFFIKNTGFGNIFLENIFKDRVSCLSYAKACIQYREDQLNKMKQSFSNFENKIKD